VTVDKVSLSLDHDVVAEAREFAGRGGLSALVNDVPDALVAAEVIDVAGSVLLTSDRDDLTLLLADHVDVRIMPI
jgi:hypothetical protein